MGRQAKLRQLKRKGFNKAIQDYFTDPNLIDWIWINWQEIIPRQAIYAVLKFMAQKVAKDPEHDWRVDFSKHFNHLLDSDIASRNHFVLGINMEEQRAWITRCNSLFSKPGIIVGRWEDIFFLDWQKTIQDFNQD